MDKKIIIAEVIDTANELEDQGFISLANKLTEIANKVAYDFNNPKKEEIVDISLSYDSDDEYEDDESDSNDKVDFSDLLKELNVDDSLENDMDDDIVSFDEENEGLDSDNDDDFDGLFSNFIEKGDVARSQIEDALAVILSDDKHFHDKTSAVLRYMARMSESKNRPIKLAEALDNMNKLFVKDMSRL